MTQKPNEIANTVVSIAILIATYYGFDFLLNRTSQLPEESHRSFFIFGSFLLHLGGNIVFFLIPIGIMCWRSNFKLASWEEFGGQHLRAFITTIVAFLVWNFAFIDRNAFLGSWHTIDRILLIASIPLVALRPQAIFLFLMSYIRS